jgi:hypothetical protein
MSHDFFFTPKSHEGDFRNLQAFSILFAYDPFVVEYEKV